MKYELDNFIRKIEGNFDSHNYEGMFGDFSDYEKVGVCELDKDIDFPELDDDDIDQIAIPDFTSNNEDNSLEDNKNLVNISDSENFEVNRSLSLDLIDNHLDNKQVFSLNQIQEESSVGKISLTQKISDMPFLDEPIPSFDEYKIVIDSQKVECLQKDQSNHPMMKILYQQLQTSRKIQLNNSIQSFQFSESNQNDFFLIEINDNHGRLIALQIPTKYIPQSPKKETSVSYSAKIDLGDFRPYLSGNIKIK